MCIRDSNKDACRAKGFEWIRRPTGGRAVLHCEDLTYSCTFSQKIASLGGSIAQTYDILSACIIKGLTQCGIQCSPHDSPLDASSVRRETKLPCFIAPNRREIMAGQKKLVGSAQKRTAGAVLQHGSIPLTAAFRVLADVENTSDTERDRHRRLLIDKCACIEELAPLCTRDRLAASIAQGFADVLGLQANRRGWDGRVFAEIRAMADSEAFRRQWMGDLSTAQH